MEIEQGIRIQQLKLLRIVAGLLALVVFVSLAPFSCDCRRWVRGIVFSILTRAECAAQHLMIAQARLIASHRGLCIDATRFFHPVEAGDPEESALPSLRRLWVRIKALRARLLDLPRHAHRLLRRVVRAISGQASVCDPEPSEPPMLRGWRLEAVRVERPPDIRV